MSRAGIIPHFGGAVAARYWAGTGPSTPFGVGS